VKRNFLKMPIIKPQSGNKSLWGLLDILLRYYSGKLLIVACNTPLSIQLRMSLRLREVSMKPELQERLV